MCLNYYTSIINSVHQVSKDSWNNCAKFKNNTDSILSGNPFLSYEFFSSLEDSGSISTKAGWLIQHILLHKANSTVIAIMPNFVKNHSWGEYVFDQAFAEAWEKTGQQYYPKLLSAVPFTPISGPRFLISAEIDEQIAIPIMLKALQELVKELKVSSSHINFINSKQKNIVLKNSNWLKRVGLQFHWENNSYENFEHFLSFLSSSKRKAIRRERREVLKSSLKIKMLTGDQLNLKHIETFYQFYLNTINKRWGGAYLTKSFWCLLIERLSKRILLIVAEENNEVIAGAINLFDDIAIYGRNWGSSKDIKFLHFEACYYQAIEFAISSKLKTVEAGAQGTHKIQRGYLPKETYSTHYFANSSFHEAVSNYLEMEIKQVSQQMSSLQNLSPYKKLDL